jgi:hypothetical protein
VVLDNPIPEGESHPSHAILLISGSLMEDYRIRSTEPKLLSPPRRRPDGRFALAFPAPIPESLNWYRVHLTARKSSPRPLQLAFQLDGGRPLPEMQPAPVQVFYTDRQADPFMMVPESLVNWMPREGSTAFSLLVITTLVLGALITLGCIAAFRTLRH